MKYNQYGRINTTNEQKIAELTKILLLPKNHSDLSFPDLMAVLFGKLFPEATSLESKKAALEGVALSANRTLYEFVESSEQDLPQNEFYAAALQFLDYHVGYDYEIANPLELFKKNNLPFLQTEKINSENLINAFYLLLCTRAKNGMTLIDNLAARGFYKDGFGYKDVNFTFLNGKSLPIFDTTKIIREVVYVESDLDTDHDGQKDLLQATIFRPVETDRGLKVPVLYTANPYFGGTNDVDSKLHSVDENLTEVTENFTNQKQPIPTLLQHAIPNFENEMVEEGATRDGIYSLNDYMLARGFANVYAGGIGTYGSDGVRLCGAPEETICAKEIIEWLTGDRIAYTNRDRTAQTKAWWSNQNVAMTGKSYLGTLATAVAATGVKGLKTVISEAAISSWYDYYREHGLVIAPELCQGEDTDILAELCQSNYQQSTGYFRYKPEFDKTLTQLNAGQDRKTGQYNDFWEVRNYRRDIKNVKCSFISVQGLNDWNVKPKNVYKLWQELEKSPVKHKLFLHQGPHTYMNNLASIDFTDMMNLWLCHELLGVQNNALMQWPDVMVQDNLEADNWHHEATWANELGQETVYNLTNSGLTENETSIEILEFNDVGGKKFNESGLGELAWQDKFLAGDQDWVESQLRFTTPQFKEAKTIVGRPKVKIKVSSSLPKGQISVALIELGKRKRLSNLPQIIELDGQEMGYQLKKDSLKEFRPVAPTPMKLIAKGHCNIQNYADLKVAKSIKADEFYELEFELQPTYYTVPENTQLGLVIYSTDMGMTKRPQESTLYKIDLTDSKLTLFEK